MGSAMRGGRKGTMRDQWMKRAGIGVLAAVLLVLTNWVKPTKGLHPILFIAASAVIGVVFRFGGA